MAQSQTVFGHVVDIHRSETVADGNPNIGLLSYSGMGQGAGTGTFGENVILTAQQCTIQAVGMGRVKGLGVLPGDAPGPGQWHIIFGPGQIVAGAVKDRDILVDELGYRYQASQVSFSQLGCHVVCIRLES